MAAFSDGTIRWYRAADGKELVALFPHKDHKQWVAWTPEGFFAASPGSEGLIGYHINRGATGTPAFVEVSQLYTAYWRPNLVFASFLDTPMDRKEIRDALTRVGDIGKIVVSGDVFILYLSGHGMARDGGRHRAWLARFGCRKDRAVGLRSSERSRIAPASPVTDIDLFVF